MAKRRTIGKDPLSAGEADGTYSAEIVAIPIAGVAAERSASIPNPGPMPDAPPAESPVVLDARARRVVGGRLEIFGGDIGTGICVIWPLADEIALGFTAPTGRSVDLTRELTMIRASPDLTEHRYLSAVGWAWVLSSLGGIAGLVVAGGLRLLEPKRMIVTVRLYDGTTFVGRTDSVTVSGLTAIAGTRSAAKA